MAKPTNSELEILQILWREKQASVKQVHEQIDEQREEDVKYTTILKLMQIMNEKGLVSRDTSKRTHIYKAEVSERATQQNLLQRFVNQAFSGSTKQLVMQALGTQEASAEELQEIKALIEKMEREQKK
ncbi:MAG: BlaI/MecI/CopY family transcriptional regulator [Bacteroidota bacterium]